MRLLLDTHALLWWLADDETLSQEARAAISEENNLVFVSPATAWEISVKRELGKFDQPPDLVEALEFYGFERLAITFADGLAAGSLSATIEIPSTVCSLRRRRPAT